MFHFDGRIFHSGSVDVLHVRDMTADLAITSMTESVLQFNNE